MGGVTLLSLYGDMTPYVKEIVDCIPEKKSVLHWAYFGKFLTKVCVSEDEKLDKKVIDEMLKKYDKQGHSGGSFGVLLQEIMLFYSGRMDEKKKERIHAD